MTYQVPRKVVDHIVKTVGKDKTVYMGNIFVGLSNATLNIFANAIAAYVLEEAAKTCQRIIGQEADEQAAPECRTLSDGAYACAQAIREM